MSEEAVILERKEVAEAVDRLRRAVLPKDVLGVLRHQFKLRQQTIGAACSITERTVRNWESGQSIRRRHADRLSALADVVLVISETLLLDGVDPWLWARLRLLGGHRAVELLGVDEVDGVLTAARAFVEGDYA